MNEEWMDEKRMNGEWKINVVWMENERMNREWMESEKRMNELMKRELIQMNCEWIENE